MALTPFLAWGPADAAPLQAAQSESVKTQTHRTALIVASNQGGPQRQALRYAQQDALTFSAVLQSLGELQKDRQIVLLDPTLESFRAGVRQTHVNLEMLRGQRGPSASKREFIFYYSGHSDGEGLLLKDGRIPFTEVRKLLVDTLADVRIAIVDACASGVLARDKGGVFHKPIVMDKEFNVRGYAILTSSSANEVSQESDALQGSYFTHSLVAGLRGVADRNRDARVTLGEAYQYAFDETVRRSAHSLQGGQHPNYALQMSGTGDVVLTRRQAPSDSTLPRWQDTLSVDTAATPVVSTDSLPKPKDSTAQMASANPGDSSMTSTDPGSRPFAPTRLGVIPRVAWPYFGTTRVDAGFAFDLFGGVHHSTDVSLACLFNVVDSSSTVLQIAGGFNVVGEKSHGLQASGIANQSGQHFGSQMAGLYNGASARLYGLQVAGVVNYAEAGRGLQLATVNIAQVWQGMQLGAFNFADTLTGMQIGFLNWAHSVKGLSFGFLSFVSDGLLHLQLQRDLPTEAYHALFQTGTKWNYNFLQATYARREGDRAEIMAAYYGLGFQIPVQKCYAAWDLAAGPVFNLTESLVSTDGALQSRLYLGYSPVRHFGVFTGVALHTEFWDSDRFSNFDRDDAGNRLNIDLRYRVSGRWFVGLRI